MTPRRTERGRGESGHHRGPHSALRRRDAILAWSTRRSDLPRLASHVGCRLVEEASGMPRRARRVVAARRKRVWVMRRSVGKGGRRGEWRAVHSPRAFGFPSAAYLLGLRSRLPGQCDRRISLQRVSPSGRSPRASDRPSWSPRCPSASHISHHSLSPPRAAGAGRAPAAAHAAAGPPRRAHPRTARARSVRPHGRPSARSTAVRESGAPLPAPPRRAARPAAAPRGGWSRAYR